jgi:uncharacterized membrane protein
MTRPAVREWLELVYPDMPRLRAHCAAVDPRRVFVNTLARAARDCEPPPTVVWGSEGGMTVDVVTDIVIDRPRGEVATFAADPSNAPSWYVNITSVEWRTTPLLSVGARVAFMARFLGRTLSYTYEIVEHSPGTRLVMRTAEGPFPMETTYTWESTPDGTTCMTLRNRGAPSGFFRVVAPLMAGAIRRANRKDLRRLKQLLEHT